MFFIFYLMAEDARVTLVNTAIQEGMKIVKDACTNQEKVTLKSLPAYQRWVEKYFDIKGISDTVAKVFDNDQEIAKNYEKYLMLYFASPNYLKYLCHYDYKNDAKLARKPHAVVTHFYKKDRPEEMITVEWSLTKDVHICEVTVNQIKLLWAHEKMAREYKRKNQVTQYKQLLNEKVKSLS